MPAIPPESVDALLFDLGGVVFEIDFGRVFAAWARHGGVDAAAIAARFSHDVFYERHERGEIDSAAYFSALRTTLGLDLSYAAFLDGWNAIWGPVIPGMPGLLRRLKAHRPLFAFTNSNPAHQAAWSRRYADALAIFDRVFVSSELGRRKPEAAAFRAIAVTVGVPVERLAFFDDTIGHVEAARALGMTAVHVRSMADVEESLAPLLLPDGARG